MSVYKAPMHGRDNRDGGQDPISGAWRTPDVDADVPTLQNGWAQVASPLELFAYRRGVARLDFKGHLDGGGASSGSVALTFPTGYLLDNDQYWHTVITDDGGTSFQIALVFIEASTGDMTLTWPAV